MCKIEFEILQYLCKRVDTNELQVIEELQGQHEMALEKISQLESIITQQSVDMVRVEFEKRLIIYVFNYLLGDDNIHITIR